MASESPPVFQAGIESMAVRHFVLQKRSFTRQVAGVPGSALKRLDSVAKLVAKSKSQIVLAMMGCATT